MILVDANLLLYAYASSLSQHARAREWLDRQLNGPARVGLPWQSLLSFVRLISNPRVFERPISVQKAWKQTEEWLGCDSVWIPQPTDRHVEVLAPLMKTVDRSNLVPDAHLAAIAIEHGLCLCSTDGDFARFADLKWENPLAP